MKRMKGCQELLTPTLTSQSKVWPSPTILQHNTYYHLKLSYWFLHSCLINQLGCKLHANRDTVCLIHHFFFSEEYVCSLSYLYSHYKINAWGVFSECIQIFFYVEFFQFANSRDLLGLPQWVGVYKGHTSKRGLRKLSWKLHWGMEHGSHYLGSIWNFITR